ncbi:hypothetical protein ACO0SA_004902 [Hanseniaspora valbyensis]
MSSNNNNNLKFTDNPYFPPSKNTKTSRRSSVVSKVPSHITMQSSISSQSSNAGEDAHEDDEDADANEDDVWYPMQPLKTNLSLDSSIPPNSNIYPEYPADNDNNLDKNQTVYNNSAFFNSTNQANLHNQYDSSNYFEFDVLERFSFEECIDLYNRKHPNNPILENDLKVVPSAASSSSSNNKVTFGHHNKIEEDEDEEEEEEKEPISSDSSAPIKHCTKDFTEAEILPSNYTVPNRFSLFHSQTDTTIHAPIIPSLLIRSEYDNFGELMKNDWWLHSTSPTDEELKKICRNFKIHPLTIEDIRLQEIREKVNFFPNYYFISYPTFKNLEIIPVYIIVFHNGSGILTFQYGDEEVAHFRTVRKRVRQLREVLRVNADWLSYAVIDDITDSFQPAITDLELEADVIEDSVFIARDLNFKEMLQRIGESRRKTMTLMRLLAGKNDVIKMFMKRFNSTTTQNNQTDYRTDISLYLGDIQDHILTMHSNLLSYEKIFSRSHSNYLAQLQVESFNANNRSSEILSRVTLIGTMLLPMNVIPSLFGMNVKIPGLGLSNYGWFIGIVLFLVLLCIVTFILSSIWMKKIKDPDTLNEINEDQNKPWHLILMEYWPFCYLKKKNALDDYKSEISRDVEEITSRLPPLPKYQSRSNINSKY